MQHTVSVFEPESDINVQSASSGRRANTLTPGATVYCLLQHSTVKGEDILKGGNDKVSDVDS